MRAGTTLGIGRTGSTIIEGDMVVLRGDGRRLYTFGIAGTGGPFVLISRMELLPPGSEIETRTYCPEALNPLKE